jgi:hypothetical protein
MARTWARGSGRLSVLTTRPRMMPAGRVAVVASESGGGENDTNVPCPETPPETTKSIAARSSPG